MVFTIIVNLYAKDGKTVEEQLRAKLAEASQTNSKDASVVDWHTMQSTSDPRKWTIVERYDQESTSRAWLCTETTWTTRRSRVP
ncbi:hypothetical protein PF008_g32693 [Phytophthora fragariae]|uniref:ABM domain-containing protein n=1 Tax=Phytophthora fragariae TaxID=53985 RepID=A0A6G0PZ17_9STRA|nr:hypothetical protein PF008_g32693 [Phytophthora fragariae]